MPTLVGSFTGSGFEIVSVVPSDRYTIRVTFSFAPLEVSPLGAHDALNPANFGLVGPSVAPVLGVTLPSGAAIDLHLGAPMIDGAWILKTRNLQTGNEPPASLGNTSNGFAVTGLAAGSPWVPSGGPDLPAWYTDGDGVTWGGSAPSVAAPSVVDHESIALSRLIAQYRGIESIENMVRLVVSGVQELDAVFLAALTRTVDTSTGLELDVLGRLVGQPRGGLDDVAYRVWIKARPAINRSSGTIPEIVQWLGIVSGATVTITELCPRQPAAMVASLSGGISVPPEVVNVFRAMIAAGVRAWFEFEEVTSEAIVLVDVTTGIVNDALGLGSTTDPAGGHLAGVVIA